MARIFLSHSSRNNPEAVALGDWLSAEGWDDLFLDLDPSRGIAAGERWERRLHEAANRCEAVLFLVSRAWLQSEWCLREFRLAQKLNKRSFGILIEPIPVGELPSELTSTWQFVNLAQGADHQIFRAVLPDGRESHVTFSKSGLLRLKTGLTRAGLDARFFQWPPEHDLDRPPYRGMRPLEAEDAGIFFGREAPTIEALDRLRGLSEAAPPRFLVVLGASGAGKSSFLRAGLLPRLARDDRAFLPLPMVRPERAAISGETGLIRSLEAALKAAGLKQSRAEVKAAVEAGAPAVTALLAALAEKIRAPAGANHAEPNAPRVVLAVDQAEELFLAEGAGEAEAFLALLRDLATDPASNLIVIATIRSDAFERLQTAPALEGIRQETLSLPPMPKGAYQTVIEGPAARLAETSHPLRIEPALTAALLADVEAGGAKDALPLLAFTLERLYLEHGGDGDLRLSEYRQIGGIKGSIDAAVEGALRAADADPAVPRDRTAREALLRRALIPWLAGIDPETGAPRRRVARLSEIPQEARPLVAHLIAARLLATDRNPDSGETTIEPAHEALLRQWSLLQGWLEEDFAALSALEAVKRAARDWGANAQAGDWLAHTAGRLDDAEALLGREDFAGSLDPTDRAYLAAARAADTARRDRELEEARKLAAAEKNAADRQRQVARRTRIGLIAASVLTLLAAGAAIYGLDQARRADEQAAIAEAETNRAEQNFAAAKQAVDSLIFDIAEGLRNVSGMRVETISKILGTVRRTVDQLAETTPDDTDLQRSRAAMLGSFVDTYLTAYGHGAIEEALAAADEMVALSRKLAETEGNLGADRDLMVSLQKMGQVRLAAGDNDGAYVAYEEGLAIARRLVDAAPNDSGAQYDLSVALQGTGLAKSRAGKREAALSDLEESLSIARRIVETDPSNSVAQRCLSVSLNAIGDLTLLAGEREVALAAFEESLEIARKLAASDPGNSMAQRDVAVGLNKIGDVRLQGGDRADARAAYDESLAIFRKLVEVDPGNDDAKRGVSIGLKRIGNMWLDAGDPAAARTAYEESLAIDRGLATADPGNAQAQSDLSGSLEKTGDALLAAGDATAALAAHDESLAIRRKLVEANPGDPDAQRAVSVSLEKIGDVRSQAEDNSGALAAFEEGLAIVRRLTEADPGNVLVQRDLWVFLDDIGRVKFTSGDHDGAFAAFEEGISIVRRLAEADPRNAAAQRDLWIGPDNFGQVKLHTGDPLGALASFEEIVAIAERMVEASPGDLIAQSDLAEALSRVGEVKSDLGELEEALTAREKSVSLWRGLVKADPDNQAWREELIDELGSIAYTQVLAHRPADAESTSREALSLSPNATWIETNLAHALMLQGKIADADALYLGNRGKTVGQDTWEQVILADFAALRKAGINHPHMAEIEAIFRDGTPEEQ